MSQPVTWLSAFIDCRPDAYAPTADYWSQVTGFSVSDPRGASDEFVSLVPAQGDDFLRLQRRDEGNSRIHLDVSVAKPRLAADEALSFGARELVDSGTHIAMASPGGLVFCFVSHGGSIRPEPAIWAGAATEGYRSAVYQVSIDIPAEQYAAEARFWGEVMGASTQVLPARPEFSWLRGDRQLALDVLLQRLDSPDGQVTAHLDLGTNDRAAEVSRHLSLGGERLVSEQFWTTMRDPSGLVYCITGRDPATGRLVAATVNP